jgi:glycosyltransferase involved in cell wall biosynthesis
LEASVLLATFRRPETLCQTLNALARIDTEGLRWELVVVDNADDPATQQLCASFSRQLPVRCRVCTTPGKSAALNRGLQSVSGNLIVLIDDDILPEPNWLQEMCRGSRQWPTHVLFGGRILPKWPAHPPSYALNPKWDRWTYGIHSPDVPEGECRSPLPMGGNMAVRRAIFQGGITYNETIGPRGLSNFTLGEDLDLILRLVGLGHIPVFLPEALVHHIIRPEQLTREWLLGRAFRQGRGEIWLEGEPSWYSTARLAKSVTWRTIGYWNAILRSRRANTFTQRMAFSLSQGRLFEAFRKKLRLT